MIGAMEVEDNLPEFTLAEVVEMESLFKKMREKPIAEEFFQELSAKFNCSIHRAGKSLIGWEQVKRWFQSKQTNLAAKVNLSIAYNGAVVPKAAVAKKRVKGPTISSVEAAALLPNLIFEARSAKDCAWFDVASFLTYRVLSSGELVVRVRFAGFGKEEDEWVSVKRAVRERSIPLEHSECDRVNVGDLVLCYREREDDALYCDAHVVEIERQSHDIDVCTCIFVVRYGHDNFEANTISIRRTRGMEADAVRAHWDAEAAIAVPMVRTELQCKLRGYLVELIISSKAHFRHFRRFREFPKVEDMDSHVRIS